MKAGFFGPVRALQDSGIYARRFGLEHPCGALLHDGYLTTGKVFYCPASKRAMKDLGQMDFKNTEVADIDKAIAPFLGYVKVPKITHAADAGLIILYEKDGAHYGEGRNCFFNDGHVQWLVEPEFQRVMAEQKKLLAEEK